MVNGGQVCMCPDYVFVPDAEVDTFVDTVLKTWRAAYPGIVANDQYTSAVSERHFDHVTGLIDDAVARGAVAHQHVPAGEHLPDRKSRKIAPTVLTGVAPESRVAREEIFGPVLVVYPYDVLDEAIEHISSRPHPLTVYWYGADNDRHERLQNATRSGSVNGNDFTANFIGSGLPFGGVGTYSSAVSVHPCAFRTRQNAQGCTLTAQATRRWR
jgi:coniferyl-aldehyde dehydrogenase